MAWILCLLPGLLLFRHDANQLSFNSLRSLFTIQVWFSGLTLEKDSFLSWNPNDCLHDTVQYLYLPSSSVYYGNNERNQTQQWRCYRNRLQSIETEVQFFVWLLPLPETLIRWVSTLPETKRGLIHAISTICKNSRDSVPNWHTTISKAYCKCGHYTKVVPSTLIPAWISKTNLFYVKACFLLAYLCLLSTNYVVEACSV